MEMLSVNELKNEKAKLDCGDERFNSPSTSTCGANVKTESSSPRPQAFADDFDIGASSEADASDSEPFQHVSKQVVHKRIGYLYVCINSILMLDINLKSLRDVSKSPKF